jgi:anti-sigma factor ChrR (cupin superfamily)
VLFVKLRQFPGETRRHVVIETHKLAWERSANRGVAYKELYEQPGFSDVIRLERWEPQANLGKVFYEQGAELFVLEGEFSDEVGKYSAGCWLRLPMGSEHAPRSDAGCILYIKRSGLPYLIPAAY